MSNSRRGGAFTLLVRVALFALVFGGVSEVWFRTVMHASEQPVNYQQQPSTVFRWDPRGPTSGRITEGQLCRPLGHWRVNKAGWISSIEYAPADKRKRPLIALLGDSYVTNSYMDTDQHIDAYVQEMLPGSDCYAFGVPGWYLEQYVALTRYVRRQFSPDVLVILVDYGDVTQSIRDNGVVSPFWWQISSRGTSFEEVSPSALYTGAGRKKRLASKSALVRYVRFNRGLRLPGMLPPPAALPEPAAVEAEYDLEPAADFMVGRLCSENPGTPIIFIADNGARYLPAEDIASTPLFSEGVAIETACRGRAQCSFIDLRYTFSRDWATHHIRFEAPDRAHWNAYANRLVARTVADFVVRKNLLQNPR